jgi:hypothetical protein
MTAITGILLTSSNLKLKIDANFRYINSLLVKETHYTIFSKKDVQYAR